MSNRCVPFVRIKARPLINGVDKSAPGIIPKETTGIVYKAAADCRCLYRSLARRDTPMSLRLTSTPGHKIRRDRDRTGAACLRTEGTLSVFICLRLDSLRTFNLLHLSCSVLDGKVTSPVKLTTPGRSVFRNLPISLVRCSFHFLYEFFFIVHYCTTSSLMDVNTFKHVSPSWRYTLTT